MARPLIVKSGNGQLTFGRFPALRSARNYFYAIVAMCLGAVALVTVVGGSPADAANNTHTGSKAATHMELKDGSRIVCKVYNTSSTSKPVARNCPNGTFTEQLFNSSWRQIGNKTVTVGGGSSPQPPTSSNGTHTGSKAATHMELKDGSRIVCKVYNTSSTSKPVARNCPNGTFTEQLFNSSWRQIGNKTVTVGGPSGPTNVSWKRVFTENFNQVNTSTWEAPRWASGQQYPGGAIPNRDFQNDIRQCKIENGALKLEAKVVNGTTRSCYLASKRQFGPGNNQNMKIEFKVDVSRTRAEGAWFGAWVSSLGSMAEDRNPGNGHEIDVLEYVPYRKPDGTFDRTNWIHPAVHDGFARFATGSEGASNGYFDAGSSRLGRVDIRKRGFHTYSVEWNKNCEVFSIDGKPYWTMKKSGSKPFWPNTSQVSTSSNHRLLLTMEVDSGSPNNIWGRPVGDFQDNVRSQPAIALVDRVTVSTRALDTSIC